MNLGAFTMNERSKNSGLIKVLACSTGATGAVLEIAKSFGLLHWSNWSKKAASCIKVLVCAIGAGGALQGAPGCTKAVRQGCGFSQVLFIVVFIYIAPQLHTSSYRSRDIYITSLYETPTLRVCARETLEQLEQAS